MRACEGGIPTAASGTSISLLLLARVNSSEHHVTIPDHANLRVGTLASILGDVATHLGIERVALAVSLFDV